MKKKTVVDHPPRAANTSTCTARGVTATMGHACVSTVGLHTARGATPKGTNNLPRTMAATARSDAPRLNNMVVTLR